MKKVLLFLMLGVVLFACKEQTKEPLIETDTVEENPSDSILEIEEKIIPKTSSKIKEELEAKGFKIFEYVDEKTNDTIIMQQYFMAFLKKGPIRGQNEEELAELQKLHLEHLTKMYELGFADISGPFGDNGDLRGVTIYNVPTLKMADSLANADPMVKAGQLEIEIHPWWAAKGFPLR